jgi:hypothetical protein
MKEDNILLIVCNSPESMYYGQFSITDKHGWHNKPNSHWYWWRKATRFEIELYRQGVTSLLVYPHIYKT